MSGSNNKKILVVDDVLANRLLLMKIFENLFSVIDARDGIEALQILENDKDVSVVLLDIIMPKLDGYEVLRQMQENKKLSTIPVVVITASDDEESHIRALDYGAVDVICKPFNKRIILHKVNSVIKRAESEQLQFQNKLFEQMINQQNEYIRISEIDSITGLYNSNAFCQRTSRLFKEYPDREYMIARCDIDHFKIFIDIYGLKEAHRLLKRMADLIRSLISSQSICAHLDADHFVACIEVTEENKAKCIEYIQNVEINAYQDFELVPRMGIFIVEDRTMDVGIMCDRALLALRTTKGNYKTRYALYEEAMRAELVEEQRVVSEVKTALEQKQFVIYLQPQINYTEGKLVGAEGLVRWIHPQKGIVPPGKFIPILERNGLITKLDEYVWETACKQIRDWMNRGLEPIELSVNISRVDMYNPNLCTMFTNLIDKYQISSDMLHLEITESSYMDNSEQLINIVEELQEKGFKIEMDDFGSGYSSLNTLKDVPVDILKLDLQFLQGNTNQARGGNILSSIVRMAHWLKLPVIAEGIETREQAEYLNSIGCSFMQGYYFSRPIPVDEFEKRFMNQEMCTLFERYSQTTITGVTDFWDATAQTTLLFNSFVGGAAIVEYTGSRVEIVRANSKYFDVLETNRSDYMKYQRNVLEYIFPEYTTEFINMLESAIPTGNETSCEIKCISIIEEKREVWIRTRARFLAQNLESYVFYISIENISDSKKLLYDNIELTEQLTSIMNTVPCGILQFIMEDTIPRVIRYNNAAWKIFDYTSEGQYLEHTRMTDALRVHPDDKELVVNKYLEVRSTDKIVDFEHRIITNTGSIRWCHTYLQHLYNEEKGSLFQCVFTDVTELKEKEFIKYSNALYPLFDEVAEFDLDENTSSILYSKKGAINISNSMDCDVMGKTSAWIDQYVVPEDRIAFSGFIKSCIKGEKNSKTIEYDIILQGRRYHLKAYYIHISAKKYLICNREIYSIEIENF